MKWIAILLCVLLLPGCASTKKKIRKKPAIHKTEHHKGIPPAERAIIDVLNTDYGPED